MASMIAAENLEDRLRKFWPGAVRWHVQMAELTTLKVGGPAQAMVMPVDMAEVVLLVNGCQSEKIPWWVVGGGAVRQGRFSRGALEGAGARMKSAAGGFSRLQNRGSRSSGLGKTGCR